MNARITHAAVTADFPLQLLIPRIGWRNHYRDGVVSASSEAVGHPKKLAYDGLTYDGWRSTGGATEFLAVQLPVAAAADYVAVGAHTLSGCTLTPQSSTNGIAWTDLATGFVAPDNRPIVWELDSQTKLHWRLFIENAPGAVSIGALHAGVKLELDSGIPAPWLAPSLNEVIEYTNTAAQGGHSLGRSVVRRGAKADLATALATYTWARTDWEAFKAAADNFAFFFWWALDGLGEIVYGSLASSEARLAGAGRIGAQISLEGINR